MATICYKKCPVHFVTSAARKNNVVPTRIAFQTLGERAAHAHAHRLHQVTIGLGLRKWIQA